MPRHCAQTLREFTSLHNLLFPPVLKVHLVSQGSEALSEQRFSQKPCFFPAALAGKRAAQ